MVRSRPLLSTLLAATVVAAIAGHAADALPETSPFAPAAGTTVAPAKPGDTEQRYELMGMIAAPKGPVLSIARQGGQGSVWIPVGETRDGITVLSYDARRDRAVISAGGRKQTLRMRSGNVVPGENAAPEPPAAEDAPATPDPVEAPPPAEAEPPPAPDSDAAQATEARMLVSDLLDIGQQQRQAYEEAARAADRRARGLEPAATDTAPSPAPPATDEGPVESTDDSTAAATAPDATDQPAAEATDATSGEAPPDPDTATPPDGGGSDN